MKFASLIAKFGSAEAAAESLNLSDDFKDSIRREIGSLEAAGGFFIADSDDDFPKSLKHAYGCPPILSVIGNRAVFAKKMISAVGTRHASAAGMNIMRAIALRLAENDVAVVSGMAMGTDAAAHNGALAAPGDANTVAVLAGGADYIWPLENEKLYHEIISRGCVVSDMPFGFKPSAAHFAQRNRIVAALGEKLVLGESNEGSGSLITAAFAKDFGRRIFAIPSHPSDPRAAGPNRMIREGAASLCSGPDDFFPKLEFMCGIDNTKKADSGEKSELGNRILDLLGSIPLSESVIAEQTGKNIALIKKELVLLEISGLIEKTNGGFVIKPN
ncbi:MAG: DNA-protecting protein DprA [Rickettsiales bacterium]|jgi:DNA processing protein|nr:DNA-protecting protein DprA [Rickettsiales bacterium]